MDGWMGEGMDGGMYGWMKGCMDGWKLRLVLVNMISCCMEFSNIEIIEILSTAFTEFIVLQGKLTRLV